MAKRAFLIMVVLLLFFSGAKAEKRMSLNNGILVTYPDEWEVTNYTWTKGSEMLFVYPIDLRAANLDYESIDKHELLTNFGRQLMITDMENFQTYYPLNGFFVATADGNIQNIPCKIALLLQESSLCMLVYINTNENHQETDILDFVEWFSYISPETAASTEKTYIRQEGNRYYLDKVPLVLDLNEDEYDIVYLGISNDAKSIQRSKYPPDQIQAILSAGITTDMIIWQIGTDGLAQKAPTVSIRIKDQKYDGIDFRNLSKTARKEVCDNLCVSMAQDGLYQMETINGIPYASFQYIMGNEMRYATILNGDMIYIILKYPDDLTQESIDMLHTVIENLRVYE